MGLRGDRGFAGYAHSLHNVMAALKPQAEVKRRPSTTRVKGGDVEVERAVARVCLIS